MVHELTFEPDGAISIGTEGQIPADQTVTVKEPELPMWLTVAGVLVIAFVIVPADAFEIDIEEEGNIVV
jgi:hypothetical protein